MRRAVLVRHESSEQGTFGRITVPGLLSLFTGECPWRNNALGVSCIPEGIYRATWVFASKWRGGRWVYLITPTDPRSGILVHSANYMGDVGLGLRSHLQGCIALGERIGWMDGQKALLISMPAVRRFEEAMKREPFELEIVNNV